MKRRTVLKGLAGLIAGTAVPRAFAQSYPDRPIRLIVPFAAGGSIDVVSRIFAKETG